MGKRIKGVLFDKDGTLLDINALWVPIGYGLVDALSGRHCLKPGDNEIILKAIGIEKGILRPNSVLASGTTGEISSALAEILLGMGARIEFSETKAVVLGVISNMTKNNWQLIIPRGDLIKTFTALKSADIKIGLATSDFYDSAITCLRRLGIEEFFDYIGADTGNGGLKPDPDLLNRFCEACGLIPCEIAVVGDSQVDIDMARNGGAGLAIAAVDCENASAAKPPMGADYTVGSIDELLECPLLF